MKITLVKKILADGSPCKKCNDVLEKLETSGQMQYIDDILVADERDPQSEGIKIAAQYEVNRAPFFVVEKEDGNVEIHTIYMKFAKEVLNQKIKASEELKEIMSNNDDLDFI